MKDDATLLRSYVEKGSEPAFTELVQRHVDLVYGAALRRVSGDTHQAADVAQKVFTTLAQQAASLAQHPMLCAWLHTATRNAALNLMISEQRRKAREADALATTSPGTNGETQPDWDRLRPVLDAAIDELPESDRFAVIARFFERKPFAELGAALKISDDAARMRTERSLEKLRLLLARRGITSTVVALETLVAGQALVAAPIGLGATLAAQAFAAGGLGAGVTGVLITLMNAKIITTAGLSALTALVLGFYLGTDRSVSEPLPPLPETPQQIKTITALRQENLRLKADVAQLNVSNAQISSRRPVPEITPTPKPFAMSIGRKQQAILNNLRQISAAVDQYNLQNGHPPSSIEDLVGEKKYIRQLSPIDGESYTGLSLIPGGTLIVTTPNGMNVVYDVDGNNTTVPADLSPAEQRMTDLSRRLGAARTKAIVAYAAAHQGHPPPNYEALIPYFASPQEGADFVELLEMQKEASR